MIREIQAKTLLARVKGGAPVFGLTYNLNLYRGCSHQCIYCDSRSECYQIENFEDVLVKINAIELLEKELPHKRLVGTIGFGSMSDPYLPVEEQFNLTRQALQVLHRFKFPAHLITKSDLILRDIDLLQQVNLVHVSVCFTITTTDDDLARKLEPGAPSPSRRLMAMAELAQAGIAVGVSMMPILPFIEDTPENITRIVDETAEHGGSFIIPWIGMSLRDRQRAHYYAQLDRHFPGLRVRYEKQYGERYDCPTPNAPALYRLFAEQCARRSIVMQVKRYQPPPTEKQLSLFNRSG